MREILPPSLPEVYSEINGRNLEFYLSISDLQGDLLKRGVYPRKVISVDLAQLLTLADTELSLRGLPNRQAEAI